MKARELYRLAADQGVVAAQSNLASMYRDGEGGDVDRELARQYYAAAAEAGDALATLSLGTLAIEDAEQMSVAGSGSGGGGSMRSGGSAGGSGGSGGGGGAKGGGGFADGIGRPSPPPKLIFGGSERGSDGTLSTFASTFASQAEAASSAIALFIQVNAKRSLSHTVHRHISPLPFCASHYPHISGTH